MKLHQSKRVDDLNSMPTELSMADDLDALDALLEEPLKKVTIAHHIF